MSTDEYVPDEQDLEVAWIEFEASADDINDASAEFDRFLARVRQEARAEGWERGHVCGYSDAQDTARNITHGPHNPYTETGDSDEHR